MTAPRERKKRIYLVAWGWYEQTLAVMIIVLGVANFVLILATIV